MLSRQTCKECSRGILTIALAVIVSSLAYSKIAYAACTFPPPTYHKLGSILSYTITSYANGNPAMKNDGRDREKLWCRHIIW
jgi:hypothetical protein